MRYSILSIMLILFSTVVLAESNSEGILESYDIAPTIKQNVAEPITQALSNSKAISESSCANSPPCALINSMIIALHKPTTNAQALAAIKKNILPNIDFNTMAKLIVGSQWQQATAQQKIDISEFISSVLLNKYYKSLTKFSENHVDIISSELVNSNKAIVKGRLNMLDNAHSLLLEYDLQKIDSHWKIVDLRIENLSIIAAYRSQFHSIVDNGGLTALMEHIKILSTKKSDTSDSLHLTESQK